MFCRIKSSLSFDDGLDRRACAIYTVVNLLPIMLCCRLVIGSRHTPGTIG